MKKRGKTSSQRQAEYRSRERVNVLRARVRLHLRKATESGRELADLSGDTQSEIIVGGIVVPKAIGDAMRALERDHGVSVSDQMATHFRLGLELTNRAIEKAHKGELDPRKAANLMEDMSSAIARSAVRLEADQKN